MNTQVSPAAATPRFIKIGEDGALLPADATSWVAVLDTKTNLMWAVEILPHRPFKEALEAPKSLTTAGFKDWRLATVEELFCLADRSRYEPAIDTNYFPETPSSWFWSSTVDASSPSGFAWSVGFYSGDSGWGSQDGGGFVRAVRPGQ